MEYFTEEFDNYAVYKYLGVLPTDREMTPDPPA